MEFRGKLSAACKPCRLAKKGCDLIMPVCTRCKNSGKACNGFRDVDQVRIIDESSKVVRKATQDKRSEPKGASRKTSESSSDTLEDEQFLSALQIREAPRTSIVDLSRCAFQQSFVFPGHWMFMNDMVLGKDGKESATPKVMRAAQACGMALITNRENVPQGRLWSQAQYVRAVEELKESLKDPKTATGEEALCTVLLLGFYESLTCDATKGSDSWQAHIRGATEILRLRGLDAAKTPVGAALFYELRPSITIDCVWHCKPIPSFLREWAKQIDNHNFPGLREIDQLFEFAYAMADLRAAIAQQSGTNQELYDRAAFIESAMVEWSQRISASPMWQFSLVAGPECDQYNDHGIKFAHAYHSPRELGAWNMYRTYRLVLSYDMQTLCERIVPREEHRKSQAYLTATLLRLSLVDEICGSVSAAQARLVPPFGHPDGNVIKAYSLVWPLFFAGRCLCDDSQHYSTLNDKDGLLEGRLDAPAKRFLWIIEKLRYIQKELGLSWVGGIIGVLARDSTVHRDFHKLRMSPFSNEETKPCSYGVPEWYEGRNTMLQPTESDLNHWIDLGEEQPSIVSYA